MLIYFIILAELARGMNRRNTYVLLVFSLLSMLFGSPYFAAQITGKAVP